MKQKEGIEKQVARRFRAALLRQGFHAPKRWNKYDRAAHEMAFAGMVNELLAAVSRPAPTEKNPAQFALVLQAPKKRAAAVPRQCLRCPVLNTRMARSLPRGRTVIIPTEEIAGIVFSWSCELVRLGFRDVRALEAAHQLHAAARWMLREYKYRLPDEMPRRETESLFIMHPCREHLAALEGVSGQELVELARLRQVRAAHAPPADDLVLFA